MKVNQAVFVKSAVSPHQYVTGNLPEVALVGRSNVGKSSLLNNLLGRRGLARVGRTPGKTRLINFFRVAAGQGDFHLVDLPGYGFAKVSRGEREKWAQFIDAYLSGRDNIAGLCVLVDARHSPSDDDMTMVDWLRSSGIPGVVVATKCDKLSRAELQLQLTAIRKALDLDESIPLVAYSSDTGQGKAELLASIARLLGWADGDD